MKAATKNYDNDYTVYDDDDDDAGDDDGDDDYPNGVDLSHARDAHHKQLTTQSSWTHSTINRSTSISSTSWSISLLFITSVLLLADVDSYWMR